ncbi:MULTISPECIES: DNA cytosine methyltransferase [Pseudomonas]|uniref:Cytosine-specific methyltransferase n=1 Tax=Pseudomonas asiatica TaxID=2219225 RepID=A0AAJ5I2R6_9PSED|nr:MULTISPECIES: DNA cytosine methyltransferase [Pseudomonas]MDS9590070.1 DNA cytosine methyltransferase [Pseudomonas sp. HTZ1]UUC20942.1 DNA cytosine methyltransferase [Pseudomonas asiatica]
MSTEATSLKVKGLSLPRINAVDLFCGVGGLTHGLMRAGINVAAGVDLDVNCKFAFELNNASKFIAADISSLQGADIASYLKGGEYSLLAGCAPCQPFSTYSRKGRNKKHEQQWPLALEFARLVEELQPDFVTMENVPQLADHQVFLDFVALLKGYSCWWGVVDCLQYGIPQTRKRLVLIASKLGGDYLQLTPTHAKPVTVRDVIGHLPAINAGQADSSDPLHTASSLSPLNMRRIKASSPGGTWRDWPPELLATCHIKSSGSTYPSVYGRMEWDKPSPTITTQCFGFGNGRFGHPSQDRAISLREAAILQTFPEEYKFLPDDEKVRFNKLGRLIGNAVPVRLGEVIAETLFSHLGSFVQAKLANS